MTTLITGAGLVGWLTAELLAARGDEVVLVDIRKPALPDRPNLAFMHCDVTDLTTLAEIVTRFGVRRIVHTAAMLSTGIRQDPARGVHVNVMGTTNVLEIARTRGIERVVCASSTTVAYTGFGRHGPEAIEEDIPLHVVSERPASIYAATKLAGEHLAYLYNDLYGARCDRAPLYGGAWRRIGAAEQRAGPPSREIGARWKNRRKSGAG